MAKADLSAKWLETPIGPLLVVASDTHLHAIEFHDDEAPPEPALRIGRKLGAIIRMDGDSPALAQAMDELRYYFLGKSAQFHVPLFYDGSEFERRVWEQLLLVPLAETCSYGDIARALDQPSAARAVGEANHVNRIPIIIPCHRCIGADGSLTGYGGGLWRKKWLLRHEGQMRPVGLFAEGF